jgi:hypothetical protein
VAYELVQGRRVEQKDAEAFLRRLEQMGIEPEQVITDGSSLYPEILSKVWPRAAHQLCLFHETRRVTNAVLEVVKNVRAALPEAPKPYRRKGRPAKGAVFEDGVDHDGRVAQIHGMKRDGYSIRAIVRLTGHSRNTIRAWLKKPCAHPRAAPIPVPEEAEPADCPSSSPAASPVLSQPPAPWKDWEEIRQFSQQLTESRFLFVHHPKNLDAAERETLQHLLEVPEAQPLRIAREFLEGWFGIFRDEHCARRSVEEARQRFEELRVRLDAHGVEPLRRVQEKMTDERFAKLSTFLHDPKWEATSNGAERMGRAFRHLQAPRFKLRSSDGIDIAMKAWAMERKEQLSGRAAQRAGRSFRGRRSRRDRCLASTDDIEPARHELL